MRLIPGLEILIQINNYRYNFIYCIIELIIHSYVFSVCDIQVSSEADSSV